MQLPVLGEAATADRFLTSLPQACGPTGQVAKVSLPMSMAEANARGWDELDVVFVTGDAYIDHPSFAMAILGRVLEAAGYRVGIVSPAQLEKRRRLAPLWPTETVLRHQRRQHGLDDQSLHGQPQSPQRRRLFARRQDRPAPDRATLSYCQRAREAYPRRARDRRWRRGVTAAPGPLRLLERQGPQIDPARQQSRRSGVLAWARTPSSKSRSDSKPARTVKDLRNMRGVAYRARCVREAARTTRSRFRATKQVSADKDANSADATRIIHNETNPYNARRLVQWHGNQAVVCNPPPLPISQAAMDRIYGLPYTRQSPPQLHGADPRVRDD